jgi:hypothetical protein
VAASAHLRCAQRARAPFARKSLTIKEATTIYLNRWKEAAERRSGFGEHDFRTASPEQVQWRERPVARHHCSAPESGWWLEPYDHELPLPLGCPNHANGLGSGHIDCLLAWVRRVLTAGHFAPGIARRRLAEYIEHPTPPSPTGGP